MRFQVKLTGDAWVELVADVEAEDEKEAVEKARLAGQWRITGDVREVSKAVTADSSGD